MTKSRAGRAGQALTAGALPGLGGPGRIPSLIDPPPRAEPSVDLESFLAKGPAEKPNLSGPRIRGLSSSAPKSGRLSSARAGEANRLTVEGTRLIKQGRRAEAIASLHRSVELNPSVAGSHHDLGFALMTAGRLEQAIEAFAAALHLDPGLANAHYSLGYIFDSLGRDREALAAYRAAVALKPDLVEAQLRLGELYSVRRLQVEAATAFRAAAAAAVEPVKARLADARAMDASGAFDEALAALRAIVEAHPDNAEAHALLAKFLGEAGLSTEAAAHHLRVTELFPEMGLAWSGVANNKKFTADDGHLIERMNAALAQPQATPLHRQALHFALGKAHDDMGNCEEAMRHFEAGNRLRARGGRLNRDAFARRIDQLIEATPPDYCERQADKALEDATPVLVVGLPRSGSTLTEQILSSHPEVAAGGELGFGNIPETAPGGKGTLASPAEPTRRLAGDYLARLRALGPGAKRVTDKTPANFMRLGVIHRIFPNATLIHCRRHPVDTALSIFTTNFGSYLDFASDRGDLVFYTRQYQRLMAHWRETLPPDRFVEVDYEALVADPEPHARRLIAACGLQWNDACLAPHLNPRKITTASVWQARQPIYRTSVERWRRYQPWLGELSELAPA
jgi:tetratricopeptide (TPR) repeat protein